MDFPYDDDDLDEYIEREEDDIPDSVLDEMSTLDLSHILYVDIDGVKQLTDNEWIEQNKDKVWFKDDEGESDI